MKTRLNTIILLGMSLFLFAAASNTHSGWQYIITSLILAVLVIGLFGPLLGLKGISIEKHMPKRMQVGKESGIEIVLKNLSGKRKRFFNILEQTIRPAKKKNYRLSFNFNDYINSRFYENFFHKKEVVHYFVENLEARSHELVKYNYCPDKRGIYSCGDIEISTSWPFGFFSNTKKHSNNREVIIYPKVIPLRGGWLSRIAQSSVAHDIAYSYIPTSIPGTTRNLREYVPGDSPRHIHWPSTARTNTIMVREFEVEASGQIVVILDGINDYLNDEYFELAVTTVASLLNVSHQKNIKSELVIQPVTYDLNNNIDLTIQENQMEVLARVKPVSKIPVSQLIDQTNKKLLSTESRANPVYVLVSSRDKSAESPLKDKLVTIAVTKNLNETANYIISNEQDLKFI